MLTAVARASVRRLVSHRLPPTTAGPLALLRASLPTNSPAPRALFSTTQCARDPAAKTTATKTRSTAAKKKTPTKKTATKKKPAAKKTKAKAKPKAKPKKRVKKVLTPEAKAAEEKRTLKKTALLHQEPKQLPSNPWTTYLAQHTKGESMTRDVAADRMRALSSAFKSLSTSELETLKNTAESNKLTNNAAYKAWVESHTAADIHAANTARARLRRVYQLGRRAIRDDRQPKHSSSAFIFFTKSRWGSGDFANRPVVEALKSIAQEWKGMSASAKQPFDDLAAADKERYEKEKTTILNVPVKRKSSPPS